MSCLLFSLSAQVNSRVVKEQRHVSRALQASTKVLKMQLFATTALPVTPRAARQMPSAFLAFRVNSRAVKVQRHVSRALVASTKVTRMRLFATNV